MNKIYEYDDSEHARIAGVSKAKVALNSNVIAFGRYSVYIAAVPKSGQLAISQLYEVRVTTCSFRRVIRRVQTAHIFVLS
jgi:hypothetical protein